MKRIILLILESCKLLGPALSASISGLMTLCSANFITSGACLGSVHVLCWWYTSYDINSLTWKEQIYIYPIQLLCKKIMKINSTYSIEKQQNEVRYVAEITKDDIDSRKDLSDNQKMELKQKVDTMVIERQKHHRRLRGKILREDDEMKAIAKEQVL